MQFAKLVEALVHRVFATWSAFVFKNENTTLHDFLTSEGHAQGVRVVFSKQTINIRLPHTYLLYQLLNIIHLYTDGAN